MQILVVDDDAQVRTSFSDVLEIYECQVEQVASAAEAINALATAGPFDLILLDIHLPDSQDLQLLTRIQEGWDIPVMMMTGFSTVDLAVDAMRRGAVDFLTKPVPPQTLLHQINRALDRDRMLRENRSMKQRIFEGLNRDLLIASCPPMTAVMDQVGCVADATSTVLLSGETGVGKELVARSIHLRGRRRDGPFITVNCAAIPRDLAESTLFGHMKGAFTGATRSQPGKFEEAHSGTLFLDEVALLPLETQGKILRVLQDRMVERLGGGGPRKLDVRVVAATNDDLETMMESRAFRRDLFYRLSTITIKVPPLRERTGDIPELAEHFLDLFKSENQRSIRGFSDRAMRRLSNHGWPGNVRELRNVIERAVLFARGDIIEVGDLGATIPLSISDADADADTDADTGAVGKPLQPHEIELRAWNREYLRRALRSAEGQMSRACEISGLSESSIRRKMVENDMRLEDFK